MLAKFKTILLTLALFAICATGSAIMIKTDTNGNMTNETGWTLYYFANDGGKMISTCSGSCTEIWKPLPAVDISVGGDLNINDFGIVLREDGLEQIAYKKWPLYFYKGDVKAGDTNGDKIEGLWFVVKPKSYPFA
jgi:predicted lipoprotein with Yx(FWY)xxD motif